MILEVCAASYICAYLIYTHNLARKVEIKSYFPLVRKSIATIHKSIKKNICISTMNFI